MPRGLFSVLGMNVFPFSRSGARAFQQLFFVCLLFSPSNVFLCFMFLLSTSDVAFSGRSKEKLSANFKRRVTLRTCFIQLRAKRNSRSLAVILQGNYLHESMLIRQRGESEFNVNITSVVLIMDGCSLMQGARDL